MSYDDTIVAPATPPGGAVALIRLSGKDSLLICDRIFRGASGRTVAAQKGFTILYGDIVDESGAVVDDVLVSVFRAPASYTGEDSVEISCHGSAFIVSEVIRLLIAAGAHTAQAGEFTMRAFLNGKMDLSQSEAVADMISSHDRASHRAALTQMRGGYSEELGALRAQLLKLASLLELELDFSDEEVEFADRTQLKTLIQTVQSKIESLISSFSLGNAIKEGVPVAIVGSPNAGKSTLLNVLLREDRAMVSPIPGTTRDTIEERLTIGGVSFRFTDTAGLRQSSDQLEMMGIERTRRAVDTAQIILYLFDAGDFDSAEAIADALSELTCQEEQQLVVVLNKSDANDYVQALRAAVQQKTGLKTFAISAKHGHNIENIKEHLVSLVDSSPIFAGDSVVTNTRHYEALLRSNESLGEALSGMDEGLPSDLLAQELRQAIYWLGTITGSITTDEILGEIFSKFCIGK